MQHGVEGSSLNRHTTSPSRVLQRELQITSIRRADHKSGQTTQTKVGGATYRINQTQKTVE